MARVIITDLADADTARILEYLTREAGYRVATKYVARFEGQARPKLGAHIRVGVVHPYLVICRHAKGEDTVSIIRVVDGRRKITRKLVQGA